MFGRHRPSETGVHEVMASRKGEDFRTRLAGGKSGTVSAGRAQSSFRHVSPRRDRTAIGHYEGAIIGTALGLGKYAGDGDKLHVCPGES